MNIDLIEKRTLVGYLAARIRRTPLWQITGKAAAWSRRFLFLTRIFRYLTITLAVIESSVILMLAAAVFLALIPPTLILAAGILAADAILSRRILASGALDAALSRERIYILARTGRFGDGFARELAASGAAVFVLTADPCRRFLGARQYHGVWYLRHTFFFRLKRRRLASVQSRICWIL
ncbi:MAG: hypothetical protein J6C52_02535 [Clostridia bacterium]|nr:hypothetical protein [Clostridia bacterium]